MKVLLIALCCFSLALSQIASSLSTTASVQSLIVNQRCIKTSDCKQPNQFCQNKKCTNLSIIIQVSCGKKLCKINQTCVKNVCTKTSLPLPNACTVLCVAGKVCVDGNRCVDPNTLCGLVQCKAGGTCVNSNCEYYGGYNPGPIKLCGYQSCNTN